MMLIIHFLLLLSVSPKKSLGKLVPEIWIEQRVDELAMEVYKARCQQHLAEGYYYKQMYPINQVVFDNSGINRTSNHLFYFNMHLSIKAERDGMILLSPIPDPGEEDFCFEIGVGVQNNQYTVLRVRKNADDVARTHTPDLLSSAEYTNFYITISDGVITLGEKGETPIITHSDIRLREVKYFSMGSWDNYVKFLYDCPSVPLA